MSRERGAGSGPKRFGGMTTGKPAARPNRLSLKRLPPDVGLPTDGRAAALAVVNNGISRHMIPTKRCGALRFIARPI